MQRDQSFISLNVWRSDGDIWTKFSVLNISFIFVNVYLAVNLIITLWNEIYSQYMITDLNVLTKSKRYPSKLYGKPRVWHGQNSSIQVHNIVLIMCLTLIFVLTLLIYCSYAVDILYLLTTHDFTDWKKITNPLVV